MSTGNRWLKVKLVGVESNRTAIGARVDVKTGTRSQSQEVQSQSSYYSVNDFRLHFGLGDHDQVDTVTVRWPNGQRETLKGVAANRLIVVEEGNGIVGFDELRPS